MALPTARVPQARGASAGVSVHLVIRRVFSPSPTDYRSLSLSISSLVLRSSQSRPQGPPPLKANTART
jgi:hypothetical protein